MSMTLGDHWRAIIKIAQDEHHLFTSGEVTDDAESAAALAYLYSLAFARLGHRRGMQEDKRYLESLQALFNLIQISARLPSKEPPCTE
jgi:hypothetical protein